MSKKAVVLRLSIERRIGMYGSAYDGPTDARAYTYQHQPGNDAARAIGKAATCSADIPAGDYIDCGLELLRCLGDQGFGIFALVDGEASNPQEPSSRELVPALLAEREALTAEVARLTAAMEVERAGAQAMAWRLQAAMLNTSGWRIGAMDLIAAHEARREGGVE